MLPKEHTDPMAAQVAEMALDATLARMPRGEQVILGSLFRVGDTRSLATAIVGLYAAQMEHRDGQRRLVLYGDWEIDPAKVTFVSAVKGP